jgi:hypothetical protein
MVRKPKLNFRAAKDKIDGNSKQTFPKKTVSKHTLKYAYRIWLLCIRNKNIPIGRPYYIMAKILEHSLRMHRNKTSGDNSKVLDIYANLQVQYMSSTILAFMHPSHTSNQYKVLHV